MSLKHTDYHTIKETAIRAGTSVSTLRRLDNRGVFAAKRTSANYRIYSTQDIYKLKKLLKDRAWFDRRLKTYQRAVAKIMPKSPTAVHQRNPQLKG